MSRCIGGDSRGLVFERVLLHVCGHADVLRSRAEICDHPSDVVVVGVNHPGILASGMYENLVRLRLKSSRGFHLNVVWETIL